MIKNSILRITLKLLQNSNHQLRGLIVSRTFILNKQRNLIIKVSQRVRLQVKIEI